MYGKARPLFDVLSAVTNAENENAINPYNIGLSAHFKIFNYDRAEYIMLNMR